MPLEYNGNLLPYAREMRSDMTPQERHLWYGFLSKYPVRFQRQKIIYQFIADFYCHRAQLVIELDGKQHFAADAKEYDRFRTEILEQMSLMVLRFTNNEVDHHFELVRKKIDSVIQERLAARNAS